MQHVNTVSRLGARLLGRGLGQGWDESQGEADLLVFTFVFFYFTSSITNYSHHVIYILGPQTLFLVQLYF